MLLFPSTTSVRLRIVTWCTVRYKYIYNNGDIPELYDLEADPGENVNRGGDAGMGKVRSELHDRLVAWYNPTKNPYRPRG